MTKKLLALLLVLSVQTPDYVVTPQPYATDGKDLGADMRVITDVEDCSFYGDPGRLSCQRLHGQPTVPATPKNLRIVRGPG